MDLKIMSGSGSNPRPKIAESAAGTDEKNWKYWNFALQAWMDIQGNKRVDDDSGWSNDDATTVSVRSSCSPTTDEDEVSSIVSRSVLSRTEELDEKAFPELAGTESTSRAISQPGDFLASDIPAPTEAGAEYSEIGISEEFQVCVAAINDTLMSTYRLSHCPPLAQEPLMFWTEQEFVLIKEFVKLFPAAYPQIQKLQMAESADPEYSNAKHAELEAEYRNSVLNFQHNFQCMSESNHPFRSGPEMNTIDSSADSRDLDQAVGYTPTDSSAPLFCPSQDFPPLPTIPETPQCYPALPSYYSTGYLTQTIPTIIHPVLIQHTDPAYNQGYQRGFYPAPQVTKGGQNCCYTQPYPSYYPAQFWEARTYHLLPSQPIPMPSVPVVAYSRNRNKLSCRPRQLRSAKKASVCSDSTDSSIESSTTEPEVFRTKTKTSGLRSRSCTTESSAESAATEVISMRVKTNSAGADSSTENPTVQGIHEKHCEVNRKTNG